MPGRQYKIGKETIDSFTRNGVHGVECFKSGFRGVIFINVIDAALLNDLIDPETQAPIKDWSGKVVKGKGIVFRNPQDQDNLQAMPILTVILA